MTLVSPILNRELLTFLRTKRAFGGLLLFLLVLSAAAGICWWATLSGGGWRDRDILSRNLFTTVTIAQLLIFSAYALILTCTTVNSERDTKTLDLLVSAPLSSLHIVLAKYTAALTVILLLVLASAPVLSLCFLLGGVGWQELVSAYCIILLAVLSYGMVGMACSTVCRKNYGALMAGFLLAAWLYCGVTLLSLVFLEWADLLAGSSSEDIILGVFETTSPLGAYMAANSMLGMPAPYLGASAVVLHAIFQLSVFVVSFLVAWLGFRKMAGRTSKAHRRKELRRALRTAKGEAIASVRGRRRRYRQIGDWANPVFAREDRLLLSRRWKHRLLRYLIALAVFLMIATFMHEQISGSYKFDEAMCGLGALTVALACVFVPLLAARAVTSERETQSLPLLIVTPLRPAEILVGKLAVVVKHAFRAEVLFTFLLLFAFRRWPAGGLWHILYDWTKILLPLLVITLYLVSVGLLFSVLCRKTVTAVVWTYATLFVLAISPYVVFVVYQISQSLSRTFFATPGISDLERVLSFLAPLVSPCFYFIPDDEINFWHENDQWAAILGYAVMMLGISVAVLAVARARLARMFYRMAPRRETVLD